MLIFSLMLLFLYLFLNAPAEATKSSSQTTCCSDGFGLNYTLPMFDQCKAREYQNGSMIQTIPKLIPASPAEEAQCRRKSKIGIPPGRRVCKFPDCLSNPCVSGWCEETMTGYQCHCPPGYSGKRCLRRAKTSISETKILVQPDTCITPASRVVNSSSASIGDPIDGVNKTTGLGSVKEEPRFTSINASSNIDTAVNTASDAVKAASQPEYNDTTSSNNDSCPQSWQQFQGYCYHHYNECLSFHEAMNRCRTIDLDCGHADLASIHSKQENDFIRKLIPQPWSWKRCWSKSPWIGFYQRNGSSSDDQFIWSDGTAVDFQFWGGNQPDNHGQKEDCATFWGSFKWNDVPCESRKPYVCKTRAMNKK